jgi:hypothetical protein
MGTVISHPPKCERISKKCSHAACTQRSFITCCPRDRADNCAISTLHIISFRRARGYVDFDEHSWPRERSYDEKRAGRLGRARVRLRTAFAGIEEIANIRHVGDDLVGIVYGGSVLFQQPLDFVPGIAALRAEIAGSKSIDKGASRGIDSLVLVANHATISTATKTPRHSRERQKTASGVASVSAHLRLSEECSR